MIEKETFGVDYERYALGKLLKRLVKRYGIKKVLEIPSSGVKAMPSIYSLAFGLAATTSLVIGMGIQEAVSSLLGRSYAQKDKAETENILGFMFFRFRNFFLIFWSTIVFICRGFN